MKLAELLTNMIQTYYRIKGLYPNKIILGEQVAKEYEKEMLPQLEMWANNLGQDVEEIKNKIKLGILKEVYKGVPIIRDSREPFVKIE
jgi:hypothetical protein